MSAKPTKRNWNDVQMVIAATAIVTTLGMWNLFATPNKPVTVQVKEPTLPPTEPPAFPEPAALPHVKIMFTPIAPQTITVAQQTQSQAPQRKKKHNNGGGGGATSVTQTKSS